MPFPPGSLLRLGVNRIRATAGLDPLDKNAGAQDALKQAGQIVVIFALMLTVIIGLVGIAIDTTYAWRESLRVQRASDAASLAGVVYMPGCFDAASGPNCGTYNATAVAKTSAGQNGFPVATNTVTASKGATPRELDITITTSVPTFFSRIFGINSWAVSRSSKAVYVTPVPMGSPLAYYGTYQLCDAQTAVPGCTAQVVPTGVVVGSSGFSQGFFGAGALGAGEGEAGGGVCIPMPIRSLLAEAASGESGDATGFDDDDPTCMQMTDWVSWAAAITGSQYRLGSWMVGRPRGSGFSENANAVIAE